MEGLAPVMVWYCYQLSFIHKTGLFLCLKSEAIYYYYYY